MSGVQSQMARGAAWMVLFKLLERSIGLVSTVVLARLLVPADFGLVALAMAVVAALELLSQFSFDVLLIQKKDATREHYDTAWTLNVLVGVTLSLALLALAGPTARFYGEPRLEAMMWLLALAPLLTGLENIGIVAFRKEMRFGSDVGFMLAKRVVTTGVTLALAFGLRSYWALVVGIVVGRLLSTGLSYAIHAYRPRLHVSKLREMAGFSAWMYVGNMASFVANRSSDFIVGKTVGPAGLGTFGVAYEISTLPTTELVAPINRAVFPGYANLAGEGPGLRDAFLRVMSMVALVTIPAGAGIAVTASTFVPLVLGPKWVAAAPLVSILAFFGVLQALQNNCGAIYYALGRPRINAQVLLGYDVLIVGGLLAGTSLWGTTGAAWALLLAIAVVMPLNVGIACRFLGIGFARLAAVLRRPVLAGAAMYFVVDALERWASGGHAHAALLLVALVACGAVTYVGAVATLWLVEGRPEGAESTLYELVRRRLTPPRSAQCAG